MVKHWKKLYEFTASSWGAFIYTDGDKFFIEWIEDCVEPAGYTFDTLNESIEFLKKDIKEYILTKEGD